MSILYLVLTISLSFLCIIYVMTGVMVDKMEYGKRQVSIIRFRTKLARFCLILYILHFFLAIFYAETIAGRFIGILGVWFFYPELKRRKLEQAIIDALEE